MIKGTVKYRIRSASPQSESVPGDSTSVICRSCSKGTCVHMNVGMPLSVIVLRDLSIHVMNGLRDGCGI